MFLCPKEGKPVTCRGKKWRCPDCKATGDWFKNMGELGVVPRVKIYGTFDKPRDARVQLQAVKLLLAGYKLNRLGEWVLD